MVSISIHPNIEMIVSVAAWFDKSWLTVRVRFLVQNYVWRLIVGATATSVNNHQDMKTK